MNPATIALRELYQANVGSFPRFVQTFPDAEGPLMIEPTAYFDQPIKLMVIGQETGGWHDEVEDVEAQLQAYRDFNMGQHYRPSPFWNVTRKVEITLGVTEYACAWSNLNRFDDGGEPPSSEAMLAELMKLDFLLKEEIRILKPDVALFFTNRRNDNRLEVLYSGLRFDDVEGLPSDHFARLSHADLPELTLRTPHPKSIRIRSHEDAFLDAVRQLATKRCQQ